MIVTRHWTEQHELLHWLLIIAAAIALTFAVAGVLGAADTMPPPRLLPDGIDALAKPIIPDFVRPFFPESPPARQLPPAEVAARLWTILDHHRAGRPLMAINDWAEVGLPKEMAQWREIAMAAAYLQIGDLERAALRLDSVEKWMPGQAATAYFTGLLRLEQAAAAGRIPNGQKRGDLLVSYTPMLNRDLYRMLAIDEFERAIVRAHEVRFEERLIWAESLDQELIAPTAGDLMTAIGAGNFAGKAHHLLFGLRLDQNELAIAEHHLNRAAETGIAVLYGYRDLSEAYLLAGRNGDAIRLGMKDLELNCPGATDYIQWMFRTQQPIESWVW